MQSLGRADGKPGSRERLQQLQDLWESDLPDLHLNIPHDDVRKNDWFDAMSNLREHQYCYAYILTQLDQSTGELLQQFRPDWVFGTEWIQNSQARREAARRAELWMDEQRDDDDQTTGAVAQDPATPLSPRDCQGRSITVTASGGFTIRWIRESGVSIATRLKNRAAIPTTSGGRYVFFTSHGIDVVGPAGDKFRTKTLGGKVTKAMTPLKGFLHDSDVLELWKAACEAHNQSTDGRKLNPPMRSTWAKKKRRQDAERWCTVRDHPAKLFTTQT